MNTDHLIVLQALCYLMGGGLLGFTSTWVGFGSYLRISAAMQKLSRRELEVREALVVLFHLTLWGLWLVLMAAICRWNIYFIIGLSLGLYQGVAVGKEVLQTQEQLHSNSLM